MRLSIAVFYVLVFSHSSDALTINLERLCIDEILNAISSNISCLEITEYFLHRIRRYNPRINAFITIDSEGALRDARKLDQYYAIHKRIKGKLHCVPTVIKDNILVQGLPITLGLRIFANTSASEDAAAVRKLRNAGAVVLGKGNMTPMAIGDPNEPTVGGRVSNPHSMDNPASSSSHGNAAAISARLAVIGLASDTIGSTSGPAKVTHVVGLRPPIPSFDMSGMFPIKGAGYDTMGSMALRVKDICTLLDVVSDHDHDDWCGSNDDRSIRVAVLTNLTYGSFELNRGRHRIDEEVIPAVRKFERNLTTLRNVSVDSVWNEQVKEAYEIASEQAYWALCRCMCVWMDRFFRHHQMLATEDSRPVRNSDELFEIFRNTSTVAPGMLQMPYCQRECRSKRGCPENDTLTNNTLVGRDILNRSILRDYDVLITSMNPHGIMSGLGDYFGAGTLPGYGGLLATGRSSRIGDMASMFSYPSLTVPIGFTEYSLTNWESMPIGAYFMTSTEKFPILMNLARRYEDAFWNPKMPDDFD